MKPREACFAAGLAASASRGLWAAPVSCPDEIALALREQRGVMHYRVQFHPDEAVWVAEVIDGNSLCR